MVQGLEGHACGHGAIADHGNALAPGVLHAGGNGHAQGGTDRRAGVAHAKGVVFTFGPFREAGQASLAADAAHLLAAAGQDLVGVGLVAHIPYQPVFRRVEYKMQCQGQFQNPQAGAEMPTGLAHRPEQECSQLPGQLGQIFRRKFTQPGRNFNPVQ